MSTVLKLDQFDSWLSDDGPAALVLVEYLQPIAEAIGEGEKGKSPIFPPTYAPARKGDEPTYIIDGDGKVCLLDSVGSQANRMESCFKDNKYSKLVPQVSVSVAPEAKKSDANGDGISVNLLDAGHRAADAIMRFSSLRDELSCAFTAWDTGNALELAKIAPTSLVFGAWDSRHTQAKIPRVVSATIRAFGVEKVHRAAQYKPPLNYVDKGVFEKEYLDTKVKTKTLGSVFGFYDVPAPCAAGGILVHGEIRREVIINLVALRAIGVLGSNRTLDCEETTRLQRYILGLALVAATKPLNHNLRQGCLLVGCPDKKPAWKQIESSGDVKSLDYDHGTLLPFAEKASVDFMTKHEVKKEIPATFDIKKSKEWIKETLKKTAQTED